ncbi:endoglycosylceramidase, partial [Kibdelosporangium lantanae]
SRLSGADWWAHAATSGPVLSGSQWHWDIYNGRHHELMNDNPSKVKTAGDAMNDEQFSAVRLDDAGIPVLTVDSRIVDRMYPLAVAGTTVAFTYEDTATGVWNRIPASMPAVRALVGSKQFGVLVWRSNSTDVPTEIHLPASFSPASVVVDENTSVGTPTGGTLDLRATTSTVHFALITTGATTPEAVHHAQAVRAALEEAGVRLEAFST